MQTNPASNEEQVRESFQRQTMMATIGATLTRVGHGEAIVSAPYSERLTQQNGFLHAGMITTLLDTACGYAAMSAAPPGYNPLAVEFKVNLMAPARGQRFEARAKVLRRGRTLTVSRADAFAISSSGDEEMVATMLQTTILRETGGA
jgi:uncharacterized protein (TIGR00369 family)